MNKLKTILFSLLCLSASVAINAQTDSTFTFLKTIKGNYTDFNVDNLDNLYLITAGNQLKKIRSNGDSVGIF
ncbi:MAG: hypothetical protein ACQUYJ_10650, partial [Ferruginibacter sp.]